MTNTNTENLKAFAELAHNFPKAREAAWEATMPAAMIYLAHEVREKTRQGLGIDPNATVVILGEQTYGLNEKDKVLGKRLAAKALEKEGVVGLELFASHDVAGSESGIYRMQIPQPNKDGYVSLNVLPGWKNRKNTATVGFGVPSEGDLNQMFSTLNGTYGKAKSDGYKAYVTNIFSNQGNYGYANAELLRQTQTNIGLDLPFSTHEGTLDKLVAKNGGMEVMLFIWPELVKESKGHQIDGVRNPEIEETPFQLYHHDDNCHGRMESKFIDMTRSIGIETPIESRCMECGHREITTPGAILDSNRPITWRAIARVFAYSSLGIADAHITGGGSIYNEVARETSEALGYPYFPITHMSKTDMNGNKTGIFQYETSAVLKGSETGALAAREFVKTGRASVIDLVLSAGFTQLRDSIENALNSNPSINSRVNIPRPLTKGEDPFI